MIAFLLKNSNWFKSSWSGFGRYRVPWRFSTKWI